MQGLICAMPASLTLHTELHKLNALMQTKHPPLGFDHPAQPPTNPAERLEWQKANRSWWEQNPMRYDWRESIDATPQSREFFEEIDKRFFTDSKVFMPYQKVPFETLVDFDNLSNKD